MHKYDKQTRDLITAYEHIFKTGMGEMLSEDLENAFVRRLNPELETEMEQYPHPYRAYVEIGQRMAVQKILALAEAGQKLRNIENDD